MLVTGQVQGVGFRHFTCAAARELGLTGWVRNLSDGRVEVLAEGPLSALEALRERLLEGPPWARVHAVETGAAEPRGSTAFEVRRGGD